MSGGQEVARTLREQEPGRDGRHAIAAGIPKIAHSEGRAKRGGWYHVQPEDGECFSVYAKGRDAWALDRLREAGPRGCTPIDQPAPRWSAYVFNLRVLGVPIETVTEAHGGEFSGTHARYVLRAIVRKGADRP